MKKVGVFKGFVELIFVYMLDKETVSKDDVRALYNLSGKTKVIEKIAEEDGVFKFKEYKFNKRCFHSITDRNDIKTFNDLNSFLTDKNIYRSGNNFIIRNKSDLKEIKLDEIEKRFNVVIDAELLN